MRSFIAVLAFIAGGPAAAAGWDELVRTSMQELQLKQRKLESDYALSKHERWDFAQDTGELVFSDKGVPVVVAKTQFVGSVSSTSKTWLWSWANRSIDRKLSDAMLAVRRYGEQNGYRKLTERKWSADETDGWEMAAVANYLLKGKGVYRPPFEQGVSYLVVTEVRWVKPK